MPLYKIAIYCLHTDRDVLFFMASKIANVQINIVNIIPRHILIMIQVFDCSTDILLKLKVTRKYIPYISINTRTVYKDAFSILIKFFDIFCLTIFLQGMIHLESLTTDYAYNILELPLRAYNPIWLMIHVHNPFWYIASLCRPFSQC